MWLGQICIFPGNQAAIEVFGIFVFKLAVSWGYLLDPNSC